MAKPFEEILAELVSAGVDFVLVGGFAINAHGHRRNTFDLDLIAKFDRPNVEKLVSALKKHDFSPRMPVDPVDLSSSEKRAEWQSRNMVCLCFIEGKDPYSVVDVFVDHPIDYDQLAADSIAFVHETVNVRVCSIEHLIQMKEAAARPKDMLDLRFLYDILDQKREGLR